MDRGTVTSYPRHYTTGAVNALDRSQSTSDPVLQRIESKSDEGSWSNRESHRSVRENHSEEATSADVEAPEEKKKKKKFKRLRSFINMFHRHHTATRTAAEMKAVDEEEVQSPPLERRVGAGSAHSSSPAVEVGSAERPVKREGSDLAGPCGLQNHGNTCFMNAVLQCLSNTERFVEYLVTDQYKADLVQALSARKKPGNLNGEVTDYLALLLKCLWTGQYERRVSGKFKEVVGRHAVQYMGRQQHDAQEFLMWLLDTVHEELNQAKKKKYRPMKDSAGRTDEQVAADSLASHLRYNNSFIHNLFHGQLRSSLTCPGCGRSSLTFDPYICLSLPLPEHQTRAIYVTVVYRGANKPNKMFGVSVQVKGKIAELRNSLAELCGVSRHHLVLSELRFDGMMKSVYDDEPLSSIPEYQQMYAFEVPPFRGDNQEVGAQSNPSGSKETLLIVLVNKFGMTSSGRRFGPPLVLRIWRDLTYAQFQSVVLKVLSKYLRESIDMAKVVSSEILFRCRVMDGMQGRCILSTDTENPFYSPSVDHAISVSLLHGNPAHIKMVAEWDPTRKAELFGVIADEPPEHHESVAQQQQERAKYVEASLDDCLKVYTKTEKLSQEDSWYCSHCKKQQHEATKKISLWTLPDVLVFHLKRFQQVGSKLHTVVRFPITGLDMTPFLSPRDQQNAKLKHGGTSGAKSSKTLPGRSVHFEDEGSMVKSKTKRASMIREERKPRSFPWKKHKKGKHGDGYGEEGDRHGSDDDGSTSGASPTTVPKAVPLKGAPSRMGPAASNPLNIPGNVDLMRFENRYDLYAVCNHYGSMTNGHYTAFCKNPVDNNWYSFDDECVHPITESQLVSNGAYLLFYVRQELATHSPLSSSASSTSSSGSSNHWIHHIPRFTLDLGDFVEEALPKPESETHARMRPNSASSAPSSAVGISPSSNEDVFSTTSPQRPPSSRVSYPQPVAEPHAPPVNALPRQRLYSNPPLQSTPIAVESIISPRHSQHLNGRHPSLKLGKIKHTSNHGDISPIAVRRTGSFHGSKHMEVRRADTMPAGSADDDNHRPLLGIAPLNISNIPHYSPEHLSHIATPRAWHSSATHLEDSEVQPPPFPVVGQGLSRSVYFTPSSSDHESCV